MSTMSDYDRNNVGEVMHEGDWFTARLFRLFQASDSTNRERFRCGFPDELAAYEAWLFGGGSKTGE